MRTIAYITDIHLDEEFPAQYGVHTRKNWERILEDIDKKNIDEVIYGGDIGELTSNEFFFDSLKEYSKNMKITLGNHDKFEEVSKHYTNKYITNRKELYYSFEDEYFKHIYLDTSSYKLSQTQLEWLTNEVITEKEILLFIHHTVLPINAVLDTPYSLRNQEAVREVLLRCNNKVKIFCGHYHMPDERTYNNITQFITPVSSYQVKKDSDTVEIVTDHFGYRLITIDNGNVDSEVLLFRTS
ncbi:MAG: metallophosphoesterase family protein [Ignavibacteriae bacterium]|nr:metallophosphoesterase family protein [Ignavibacteriota bacterium]